jgi:hypothetical protein
VLAGLLGRPPFTSLKARAMCSLAYCPSQSRSQQVLRAACYSHSLFRERATERQPFGFPAEYNIYAAMDDDLPGRF